MLLAKNENENSYIFFLFQLSERIFVKSALKYNVSRDMYHI